MNSAPDTKALPLAVLAPKGRPLDIEEFLRTARRMEVAPFSLERVALLEDLSQRVLKHARLRRDPAGVALGFWLRRSHLAELRADFERGALADTRRVAAGLVLHIAPANVDTMFVLSWALSFLAGNANVVRLTSNPSPLMHDLLDCLNEAFAGNPAAGRKNVFVTYGHDDAITARFSGACDVRLIWGGDETVRRLRAVPLNPHAGERAFASKRSLSLLVASAYLREESAGREQLVGRMAADLAPFGQLACSSPQVLYWLGSAEASRLASADFGARLEAAMAARLAAPDMGWATRRINHAFAAAVMGHAAGITHQPYTTNVEASAAASAESEEICGAGLVTHTQVESLAALANLLRTDHQTITYFGFDAAEKEQLAILAGRAGVDRIVPVGRALDFGPRWDGYDLWAELTRHVTVL